MADARKVARFNEKDAQRLRWILLQLTSGVERDGLFNLLMEALGMVAIAMDKAGITEEGGTDED